MLQLRSEASQKLGRVVRRNVRRNHVMSGEILNSSWLEVRDFLMLHHPGRGMESVWYTCVQATVTLVHQIALFCLLQDSFSAGNIWNF